MNRALALLLLLSGAGAGCVSARMSDHQSDRLFREGRYEEAADRLIKDLEKHGEDSNDALLYMLDIGLSLHAAGRYEESNSWFLKADKVAEIKDYTSLAEEGATLLTGENVKDYKGEDFEKVLISAYLAMNFALMGKHEDALVEARRVNRKLYLMITEGKRKYEQSAFARYFAAVLYESEGEYNDAYVDYKETRKLTAEFPYLGRDLWRMAWLLRDPEAQEKYRREFSLTPEDIEEARRAGPRSGKGEIVVLYENGISPIKRPNPSFDRVPKFYPRHNPARYATVEIDGAGGEPTRLLHDIESTAIRNLDDKYAGLIAKRIAGVVAKEVVAHQVEKQTDSPVVGFLTRVILHASDQADLRSWNLLPRDLQIARVLVDPGEHKVRLRTDSGAYLPEQSVKVEAGKKAFVNFRFAPP